MTKQELITAVSDETGMTVIECRKAIESAIEVVKGEISEGGAIYIRGLGTLSPVKRAQKVARVIKTNQAMVIPEHMVPKFKPSKEFIEMCNVYRNE